MDIDIYLKNSIKNPKQVGDRVLVYNGNNELVETYSVIALGKSYFFMSNDSFFNLYGFNFAPRGRYWDLSKRAAGKM